MTREYFEKRKQELMSQRDQLIMNLASITGAVTELENLFNQENVKDECMEEAEKHVAGA